MIYNIYKQLTLAYWLIVDPVKYNMYQTLLSMGGERDASFHEVRDHF